MRIRLPVLLLCGLSACGLSEKQCQTGDWLSIGIRDGQQGYLPDRLQRHAKSCGEFGITPDASLWEKGRQKGLKFYCTVPNAYDVGRQGSKLRPSCPAIDIPVLSAANEKGRRYYEIQQDIQDLEQKLDEMAQDIAEAATDPNRVSRYSRSDMSFLRIRIALLRGRLLEVDRSTL